jgi:hypothetical protein
MGVVILYDNFVASFRHVYSSNVIHSAAHPHTWQNNEGKWQKTFAR